MRTRFLPHTFSGAYTRTSRNRWEWAQNFRWSILIKCSPRLLVGLPDMIMAVSRLRVWFDKMFTAWITGSLRIYMGCCYFFPFLRWQFFLCTESYWSKGASLLLDISCFSSIQNDKSKNGLEQSPAAAEAVAVAKKINEITMKLSVWWPHEETKNLGSAAIKW